jgi:uncharacterized protein (DUF2235 family)
VIGAIDHAAFKGLRNQLNKRLYWPRTNVWRMFSALDLSSNDQVACYDDGVGTSSFKLLAILGGAFGIGLRRNVISLYKFACRNFRVPGDEIYGLWFQPRRLHHPRGDRLDP